MKQLEYTVRFITPAFLGNAEQAGQWRTPPFKALLRQWWRVAYAANKNFAVDVDEMRREEGLLFGNAWLSHREGGREVNHYSKSLVRLRLSTWESGKETKQHWGKQELDKKSEGVDHPEVGRIGPKLYLGYGPLVVEKVERKGYATVLKNNAAIQAGEGAILAIAWPSKHKDPSIQKLLDDNNAKRRIERALWLMDRYGTVGGRSRNGWGSFTLAPINGTPKLEGQVPIREWAQCLNEGWDWPHAIGAADKPLIWQTTADYGKDWKKLMRDLAIVKIGLRTQFVFPNVKPHARIEPRHWLSYPITTHTTLAWDRGARLPNQLRFKMRRTEDDKLVGVIFHVPHLPPPAFSPNPSAIQATWRQVHALLDELTKPGSVRSYSMITDIKRRADLKSHLNTVMLKRVPE